MKSIISTINSIVLPSIEDYSIRNAKGEVFAAPVEGLFSIDWKTLTATTKSFDFALAKTKRAYFAAAVMGEYFARDLAILNDERAKYFDVDFDDIEDEKPENVEAAKKNAAEIVKRIEAARDYIEARAKSSGSVTVKAIVSAIRDENAPAELIPFGEKLRKVTKEISDLSRKVVTAAEADAARAILAKPADADADAAKLDAAAKAAEIVKAYEISESKNAEGVPNLYPIRAAATKLTKALWKGDAPEGVENASPEASHALTLKLFGMIRKPRQIGKKGLVKEPYAAEKDLIREVVLFVVEAMQARAKREAADAAKIDAAPAPAKSKPAKNAKPAK